MAKAGDLDLTRMTTYLQQTNGHSPKQRGRKRSCHRSSIFLATMVAFTISSLAWQRKLITMFDLLLFDSDFVGECTLNDVRFDNNAKPPELREFNNTSLHYISSQCPRNVTSTEISATLISQSSVERIPLLEVTCKRWVSSPIVAAIFIKNEMEQKSFCEMQESLKQTCPHMTLIPYLAQPLEAEKANQYPVNKLRNIALDAVQTSHVFNVDVDFIPSTDLDKVAEASIHASYAKNKEDIYQALIVPAFERTFHNDTCTTFEECFELTKAKDSEFIPRTVSSLSKCFDATESPCVVFHEAHFFPGHGPTRAAEWLKKMDTKNFHEIGEFIKNQFEPYVIIPWCPSSVAQHEFDKADINHIPEWAPLSPYFDERFHGYFRNKIQMNLHLASFNYHYSVIPARGFLVHHPHAKSERAENENLKKNMIRLFEKFESELDATI